MLIANEQERNENERSVIVQTAFFKQQTNLRRDRQLLQDQLAKVVADNQQLEVQEKYFQFQYERLQQICTVIKNDAQEMRINIPVLDDPKLWEPRIKQLNLLTSATDNFIKEVVKHGRTHRNDVNTLKTLSDDLEATSNLLSSPTAQNMDAFQKRLSDTSKYKNDTKIYDTMQRIGVRVALMSVAVTFAALGAVIFLGLPAVTALSIMIAAKYTCLGAWVSVAAVDIMKGISANKAHPITAHQKTIAEEMPQYLSPAPSFG